MTDQLTIVNEQPTLSSLEVAEIQGKKGGLSMDNRKTILTERENKVLSLIRQGKENAITVKDIISVIGGNDEEIRAIVRRLIEKHGYLIGSSNHIGRSGYYCPETNEEKEEAVSKLEKRAAEILKRANIMRNLPLINKDITFEEGREW
ncbi:hypothetical protein [Bacillus sp. TL12]|uniref:hypothetical protein n=1 Tax=Bacillus sp. TL12 TaxID=2894756 RepID=UPI001F51E25A|nr:hypothetical protein [Bacillus sp. TL12]MCI0764785.1 hypothetical protein [Bacillus sp. TL12]